MRKILSGFGFSERGNLNLSIRNILDNKEIITYELKVNQRKSFMWNNYKMIKIFFCTFHMKQYTRRKNDEILFLRILTK